MEHREDSSGRPRPMRILLKPRLQSQDQKRASERTSTHRSVSARLEGQDEPTEVPLVNVSPTGLQLSAGESVEPGTRLVIEALPGRDLGAIVRWSREESGDFLVGAEWETPLSFDDVWKIRTG